MTFQSIKRSSITTFTEAEAAHPLNNPSLNQEYPRLDPQFNHQAILQGTHLKHEDTLDLQYPQINLVNPLHEYKLKNQDILNDTQCNQMK